MYLRACWPWQLDYTTALLKRNRHERVTDNWRHVPLTTFYWRDSKIAFMLCLYYITCYVYVMLYKTLSYDMLYNILCCVYVMLRYITCYLMLCYITCYVLFMLCYITCFVILCLCYVTLYNMLSCVMFCLCLNYVI